MDREGRPRKAVRRRPGRPSARSLPELERRILESASRAFLEHGYVGASIEGVALGARTGKQTIYRRYPTKQDLFGAVVARMGAVLAGAAAPLRAEAGPADPPSSLRRASLAALEFATTDEALGICRLLIGDGSRVGGLRPPVVTTDEGGFHPHLLRLLLDAAQAGQIRAARADMATICVLSGLLTGWTVQRALLGGDRLDDPDARMRFFGRAWDVFLHGVSASARDRRDAAAPAG